MDWIVGNALLPDSHRGSVMLSEDSFQQLGSAWTYQLTNDDIEAIKEDALDLSIGDFEQLEAIKYIPYTGRAAFIAAVDTAIGSQNRIRYQTLILGEAAETTDIPEAVVYKVENSLKNLRFDDDVSLRAKLAEVLEADLDDLYGNTFASFSESTVDETPEGFERVDRSTVVELREVAASLQEVQSEINNADRGLNPLGLVKNALPFDIDPTGIDQGQTHFEQIYERAVQAMNNAIGVFNYANQSSQILRRQADTINDFENVVKDREADFKSRLIEIFGYPYADDIGGAGTYPAGYNGPDIYHFTYVDLSEILGENEYANKTSAITFTANFEDLDFDANGDLTETSKTVTYNLSSNGFGLVKPESWTGTRRSPGEIQFARSDLMQTNARFQRTLKDYDNLLDQIEDQVYLLGIQKGVDANEIRIYNDRKDDDVRLNRRIRNLRELQQILGRSSRYAIMLANAISEGLPKINGFSNDFTSIGRSVIRVAGTVASEIASIASDRAALGELSQQQAKEIAQAQTNIEVITNRQILGIEQQLKQIEQLIRQEAVMRLEIYTMQEALQQSSGRYLAMLSRGQRLLEDRLRFRQQTAATIQEHRYKDMAFRIFRNDALQKYRAQYDLAAKYVYLAAKAYDYETNMLDSDSQGPGKDFLTDIVRSRQLGIIQNGAPQTAGVEGDPGLADPMARMNLNWNLVIKSQLGFNNPQREMNDFSQRRELFRIPAGAAYDEIWRETLKRHLVDNVLDHPAFQRYARPFNPTLPQEPALVIPFPTTIQFGLNAFGWPLGGLDSSYDSSQFATKIRGVGVWLSNYNPIELSNTPRVYLLPVGNDIMRTPTDDGRSIREWTIYDQKIPVPFPISEGDFSDPDWIPINDSVSGSFSDLRKFSSFRAYHGVYDESNIISDSRLIGRSVWNTQWVLIIPAGTLLNDRDEGLARLIHGSDQFGERDGNGIKDIVLYFNTYSYSGN